MLFFNGSRGEVKNQFFQFLAKNMGNRKKFAKKKSFVFLLRIFWEQKLSHLLKFVDLSIKKPGKFSIIFSPPYAIFQTKHIGIIPTVQILCINDFPSSKILLHDLRTHKAHYETHFARGQWKKSIKFAFNLLNS